MHVAEEEEEDAGSRTCRICLECSPAPVAFDASKVAAGDACTCTTPVEEQFVSPCACTGTQAFVHLRCLRRWQVSVMSSRHPHANHNPALICSVCTQRFTIAPPKRVLSLRIAALLECHARELTGLLIFLCTGYLAFCYQFSMQQALFSANEVLHGLAMGRGLSLVDPLVDLKVGALLVASPSMPRAATLFYKSVVLIYDHSPGSGSLGVILNKPVQEDELAGELLELPEELSSAVTAGTLEAAWGGPVARHEWLLLRRCPWCTGASGHSRCACGCTRGAAPPSLGCHGARWLQQVSLGLCLGTDLGLVLPAAPRDAALEVAARMEHSRLRGAQQESNRQQEELHSLAALRAAWQKHREPWAKSHLLRGRGGGGGGLAALLRDPFPGFVLESDDHTSPANSGPLSWGGGLARLRGNPAWWPNPLVAKALSKTPGAAEGLAASGEDVDIDSAIPSSAGKLGKELHASQHLLLGRAGWRKGQLAREIMEGWWVVVSEGSEEVLTTPLEDLWETLSAKKVGGLGT